MRSDEYARDDKSLSVGLVKRKANGSKWRL